MFRTTLLACALAVAAGATVSAATGKEIVKKMPAFPRLVKEGKAYTMKTGESGATSIKELSEKGLVISQPAKEQPKDHRPFRAEIWENPVYEWKIDSVIGKNAEGTPTVRQTFEFDERGNSRVQKNFMWNPETGDWAIQNSEEITWNEANSPVSDRIMYYAEWGDSGSEVKYNYGENLMYPESCEMYMLDSETGEWKQTQKSLWQYDSNGFMTEEIIMVPDESGNLVNYSKATAAYTPYGHTTAQSFYMWNGAEWEPNGSRITTEYNSDELMTYWLEETWTGAEWQYVKRIVQEWDTIRLTYQSLEYYNPETDDWHGDGFMGTSTYATLEYDEQGRPVLEKGYVWDFDEDDWVNNCDITNSYEPLEDGGYRNIYHMIFDGEVTDYVVYEYNKAGNLTYMHEDNMAYSDTLMPYNEIVATYDESGEHVLEQCDYMFDGETKLAYVKQVNTWNEEGMPTESYFWHGRFMDTGDGEPDEWMPFTHFIYETENGVELGRWCYRAWDGENFEPFWGNSRTFDFSVPIDKVCYWQNTDLENAKYMITSKRVYNPDGMDWVYDEGIYYNSKMDGSGVAAVSTDSNVKVGPNPATDHITVTGARADRYYVYSMQGAVVATSDTPEINVSALPQGIYLVRAGDVTARFIKK